MKNIRFYTELGTFVGWNKPKNISRCELINWIRSGNKIKVGCMSYYCMGKSNTHVNNTYCEIIEAVNK